MIEQTKVVLSRLRTIFADGIYNGAFESFCYNVGWNLRIVRRSDRPGFHVLPKRWIVERTFAWLTRNRRLTADYETTTTSSEAFIQLAMIRLMVKGLAKWPLFRQVLSSTFALFRLQELGFRNSVSLRQDAWVSHIQIPRSNSSTSLAFSWVSSPKGRNPVWIAANRKLPKQGSISS